MSVIEWLLDSDPSIRWQVMRDLTAESDATVAIGAHFGEARDRLADRLLQEQLSDGGWNCAAPPSQRSSFHTTICVLEGLLRWRVRQTAASRRCGRSRAVAG